MDDRHQLELEARIHQELRQLPDHAAPAALAPRVMAALRAQAQMPWWQRSFWAWPKPVQATFVILLALLPVLFNLWIIPSSAEASRLDNTFSRMLSALLMEGQLILEVCVTLASALSTAARACLQPPVVATLIIAFLMYLWCVGTGTVLLRVIKR